VPDSYGLNLVPLTPDIWASAELTTRGAIRYGVCETVIHAAQTIRLKPEVINVFLSLGARFSGVETSLFVS
jgi:hypothetical protein